MVSGVVICLYVFSHVVVSSHLEWPSCSGGSSLRGLDEWKDRSQHCCDSPGICHGYDSGSVAKEVVGSLQSLLNATLPIQKSRIKRDFGHSDRVSARNGEVPVFEQVEEAESAVSPCCHSKVSVFYPITGFSAISRKRVAIIQIAPFKQPVVYKRCLERGCRILRGHCTQVYSPQPLYILTTDEGGKLAAKLDFILVEAGCQCQTRPLGDAQSASVGVDSTVREALRIITGTDFDEDYLAMLAAIDAASAIAGLDQPITRPRVVSTSTTSNFAASNTTPDIDQDDGELGNLTTVTPGTAGFSSPSVETLMISLPYSSSTKSSHDLGNNEITSPSPPTPATTPATTTTTTTATTTTASTPTATTTMTTTTTAVTVLPLPELPENGMPIFIRPGQFNPVMLSIQKFLKQPIMP